MSMKEFDHHFSKKELGSLPLEAFTFWLVYTYDGSIYWCHRYLKIFINLKNQYNIVQNILIYLIVNRYINANI